MAITEERVADFPIDSMFLQRWSPRAFTGESISQNDLMSILEAARWAPSSSNAQPWRFVYAHRDTPGFAKLLDLLVPFNRDWARHAAALVFLVSKTTMRPPGKEEDVPSPTHSLDAGTASGFFMLQALKMGWHTHGMGGFFRDRAPAELNLPDGYVAEAAYAIGRQGDAAQLPEALRAREKPSSRLPLTELAFEGTFGSAK